MYSLEDLEDAREDAKQWEDACANDRSNNPNSHEAQRRDAGIKIRQIEKDLKDQDIILKTDHELLEEDLDRHYPSARSKTVVLHNGKKYQVRYFPLVQSCSRKTVKEWGHEWVEVE